MRFVVEAMGLTDSGGKRIGVNLLSQLRAHTRHEFVLLIPDLPEYGQIQGPNIKAIRRPVPKPLWARHRFLSRTVPNVCRDEHADAFLGLGNFAPRKLNCPAVRAFCRTPSSCIEEPLGGTRHKRCAKGSSTPMGDTTTATSPPQPASSSKPEAMKRHLCTRYGIASNSRIAVIPPGPMASWRSDGSATLTNLLGAPGVKPCLYLPLPEPVLRPQKYRGPSRGDQEAAATIPERPPGV